MAKRLGLNTLQVAVFLITAAGALAYIMAIHGASSKSRPAFSEFYPAEELALVEPDGLRPHTRRTFWPGQPGYEEWLAGWTAEELIAELKYRRQILSGCDYPPYPYSSLVALGKDAVPALSEEFSRTGDETMLQILTDIGEPAVPALAGFLRDPRLEVRLRILNALSRGPISSHAGAAMPALFEMLKDTKSFVVVDEEKVKLCERAASFLDYYITSPSVNSLPTLRAAVADPRYPLAQRTAAGMLGDLGIHAREAVPALINATDSADESVRRSAIWALGRIGGPEAVTGLAACLQKRPERYIIIAEALGETKEPSAIPVLVGRLRTGPWFGFVRREFKNFGEEAVDHLVPLLSDGKPDVREAGAWALSYLGPNARRAVEPLLAALKDSCLYVRSPAASALGNIGPEAAAAVPDLIDEVKRGNQCAIGALGQIGPAASDGVEVLVEVIKDKKREWIDKRFAVESLGRIGAAAESAIPYLESLIEKFPNPNSDIRQRAEEAIKLIRKARRNRP